MPWKQIQKRFRVAKFYIRCSKALSFAKIAKLAFTRTVAIFAKVLSYTEKEFQPLVHIVFESVSKAFVLCDSPVYF